MTFALNWAEVGEPEVVTAALRELTASAIANLRASEPIETAAAQVAGMTPNAAALRMRLAGHRSEGMPAQSESVVFASGMRVFQATVLGAELDGTAAQTFIDALVVRP